MQKIQSIQAVDLANGYREYVCEVLLPEGVVKRKKEKDTPKDAPPVYDPCHTLKVTAYRYIKNGAWTWQARLAVEDCYQIVDAKLGCVSSILKERQEEADRLNGYLQALNELSKVIALSKKAIAKINRVEARLKELQGFNFHPCDVCTNSEECDKKRIYINYPKVRLSESAKTIDTWNLAASVAAVVAKIVDPEYPKSLPQSVWVGIQKCSNCKHCEFIKRDNDPDGIDAVTGTITMEEGTEYERSDSTMDNRHDRDTRVKKANKRCKKTGRLVEDWDACHSFNFSGKYWVPKSELNQEAIISASVNVEVEGNNVVGDFAIATDVYKTKEVK